MTVALIHDALENVCPDGAGFAISIDLLAGQISQLLRHLEATPDRRRNIRLDQTSGARFSFDIESAFDLDAKLQLSMRLRVWLHPAGDPEKEIVSLSFDIAQAVLEPLYDSSIANFGWISKNDGALSISMETWAAEPELSTWLKLAGYKNKDQFLEEIYYGFKWLNGRNLLPTIFRQLPFPQVQSWFRSIALDAPFEFKVEGGYLIIWTNFCRLLFHNCGETNEPSDSPKSQWDTDNSNAPGSQYDNTRPPFLIYVAAQNLASWQARQVAPALAIGDSGGGFVNWSYDAAVAVRSFNLRLVPNSQGGAIVIHLDLRVFGTAQAWIDGPSGIKMSLASAGLTADGRVDASAGVDLNPNEHAINLVTLVDGEIFRNSVNLSGGGLFSSVLAEIIEALFKRGAIKVPTAFHKRTSTTLIDLADIDGLYESFSSYRVGRRSLLVFYQPNEG